MDNLSELFKLMQLTRNQPMYGYNISGIGKQSQSDLAQHHYLTTFIAWQISRQLVRAGTKLNVERVMEMAMVHDLDELFGGDLSFYYARVNPAARKAAKSFQAENHTFLKKFFGGEANYYGELIIELEEQKTDESAIAKLADYIEALHYKFDIDRLSSFDLEETKKVLSQFSEKLRDPIAKIQVEHFLNTWLTSLPQGKILDIIRGMNANS